MVADSDALTRVTLADGVATVAGSWPLTAPFTSAQGLALSPDAHWLARVVSGELTIQDAVAGETRARVTDVQDIAPHRPLIFAVDGQSLQVPGVGRYDLDGQRLGDAVDGLFLSDDRGGIWRAIPESSDPDGRVAALERPATGETFNGPYPLAMSTLGHVPALVLSAGPRLLLAREWMLDLTDSLGHTQTRVLSVSPESWSGSAERHLVASANNGFISLWGVPQP